MNALRRRIHAPRSIDARAVLGVWWRSSRWRERCVVLRAFVTVGILFGSVTLHHRGLPRGRPPGCRGRPPRSTRLAHYIRSITTDAAWHIDLARKLQRFRLR